MGANRFGLKAESGNQSDLPTAGFTVMPAAGRLRFWRFPAVMEHQALPVFAIDQVPIRLA